MDDPGRRLFEVAYTFLGFHEGMLMKIPLHSRVHYLGREGSNEGLRCGDIGYVIEDYCDGNYEVEFSNPDGTTRVQAVLAGSDLELAEH